MRILELSSDGALLTVTDVPGGGQVNLPSGVTQLESFAVTSTGIQSVENSFLGVGVLTKGTLVQVLDESRTVEGILENMTNSGVILNTDQGQIFIAKPKRVQTKYSGSLWQVNSPSSAKLILHADLSGLNWYPIYKIVLDSNPDLLKVLALDAQIVNSNLPFEIDQLILSVTSQHETSMIQSNSSSMVRSAQSIRPVSYDSTPEIAAEDQVEKYRITGQRLIPALSSIPVWNLPNLQLQRFYFLSLGQKQIWYGYQFTTDDKMYFPPGKINVYNPDFSLLKSMNFQGGVQKRATLKIENSADLDLVSEVNKDDRTNRTVYDLTITSRKDKPVILKVTYPVWKYDGITADPRPEIYPQWGEMIWNVTVNPGKNSFSGSFVIT